MNHRRTQFRDALDQLTRDFAEGVLDAVRGASLVELVALFDQHAPSSARQPPARAAALVSRRRSPLSTPWQPLRVNAPPQPERSDTGSAEPDDSTAITDPASVLEALDGAAGSAPDVIVAEATDSEGNTFTITPREVSAR